MSAFALSYSYVSVSIAVPAKSLYMHKMCSVYFKWVELDIAYDANVFESKRLVGINTR